MEQAIERIVQEAKQAGSVSARALDRILRERCAERGEAHRNISKRACMAFYARIRAERTPFWESLGIDEEADRAIMRALRAKPRRTASGVATITVLTRPHPCSADCLYCPNDIRMPKSYLSDEPACQRAERNLFDPYLQVMARLHALEGLGHVTDKVEMIVLGGTFSEYPHAYRLWFVSELFRALNEFGTEAGEQGVRERRARYADAGIVGDADANESRVRDVQGLIDAMRLSYNEAYRIVYGDAAHEGLAAWQCGEKSVLRALQAANAHAAHRMVGLVVETRPEAVDADHLMHLRALGCTKVQIGIQSLDDDVLAANVRDGRADDARRALALLRLFGFKSHVHYMVNLLGSTPERDAAGYARLMSDPALMPDEVKLYPCALVGSARLMAAYEQGSWRPYGTDELIGLLGACVRATPPQTRISRMIRDISSNDIVAGNKATNLRQMVEASLDAQGARVSEIRMREVAGRAIEAASLSIEEVRYTTSNTTEVFLQWVGPDDVLAGFLRLSLPDAAAIRALRASHESLPLRAGQAMIREVHVYGAVSRLHEANEGTQHLGLGRRLIARACRIAREHGYDSIAVISAVGTREYYEALGFENRGPYHVMEPIVAPRRAGSVEG